MGTNYYFRKKTVDPRRIDALVDSLNDDFEALITKYNRKLRKLLSEMEIDSSSEFNERHSFISPIGYEEYDIHVGKLSGGWKPLMQASEHFNSVATLIEWYEKNKDEYNFIDECDEVKSFEEYIAEIAKRNSDDERKDHPGIRGTDGYDWEYRRFS